MEPGVGRLFSLLDFTDAATRRVAREAPHRSAFVVPGDRVLTAWHCIAPLPTPTEQSYVLRLSGSGATTFVPLVYEAHDEQYDVALLALDEPAVDAPGELQRIQRLLTQVALPLTAQVRDGASVAVPGFPVSTRDSSGTRLTGRVTDVRRAVRDVDALHVHVHQFQTPAPEAPDGLSGAPVILTGDGSRGHGPADAGSAVGIVRGFFDAGETADGTTLARGGGLVATRIDDVLERLPQLRAALHPRGPAARLRTRTPQRYLASLPAADARAIREANQPGLDKLDEFLRAGQCVAVLGEHVSMPLYPVWPETVERIAKVITGVSSAHVRQVLALSTKDASAALTHLNETAGDAEYVEALSGAWRLNYEEYARATGANGRTTWTRAQELVCRLGFAGLVATNPDPGVTHARSDLLGYDVGSDYSTWQDLHAVRQFQSGQAFVRGAQPVTYPLGIRYRPESIWFPQAGVAPTPRRQHDYRDVVAALMGDLLFGKDIVWVGFPTGSTVMRSLFRLGNERLDADGKVLSARHLWLAPLELGDEPVTKALDALNELATDFKATVIAYPSGSGAEGELATLLAELTPPATDTGPTSVTPSTVAAAPVARTPAVALPRGGYAFAPEEHFVGRERELEQLNGLVRSRSVAAAAVAAWGGAGKTSLVMRWAAAPELAPRFRGVFAWSFSEAPDEQSDADAWAREFLRWHEITFGIPPDEVGSVAKQVLWALDQQPVLLILDGIETQQQDLGGREPGFVLDSSRALRDVIRRTADVGGSFVVLTSRLRVPQLEPRLGLTAQYVELPPLTPAEGAQIIARSGAGWVSQRDRERLTAGLGGLPLALRLAGAALSQREPGDEASALIGEIEGEVEKDARIRRVMEYYTAGLDPEQVFVVQLASLWNRPRPATILLTFGKRLPRRHLLAGWTTSQVEDTVTGRLQGLVTLAPDKTLTVHPLVRQAFRSSALAPEEARAYADFTTEGIPRSSITTVDDAQLLVDGIETLLEVDAPGLAEELHGTRLRSGRVWWDLHAYGTGRLCEQLFLRHTGRRARRSLADRARHAMLAGALAIVESDWGAAERLLVDASSSAAETGDTVVRGCADLNLAYVHLMEGRLGQAGQILGRVEASPSPGGDGAVVAAAAHLLAAVLACVRDEAAEGQGHLATGLSALTPPIREAAAGLPWLPLDLWEAEARVRVAQVSPTAPGASPRPEGARPPADSLSARALTVTTGLRTTELAEVRERARETDAPLVLGWLGLRLAEELVAASATDDALSLVGELLDPENRPSYLQRCDALLVRAAAYLRRGLDAEDTTSAHADLKECTFEIHNVMGMARTRSLTLHLLQCSSLLAGVEELRRGGGRELSSAVLAWPRAVTAPAPAEDTDAPIRVSEPTRSAPATPATPPRRSEPSAAHDPDGLARRLRSLRQEEVDGRVVTQRQVAEALGLSVPLISAWESSNSPVLPTEERLAAYARLFASPRSFEGQRPTLLDDLDRGEELRRRELLDELVRLRESASEERRRAAVVNERTTFWSFQDEQPITVLCSRLDDHQLGGDDQRLPDYASPWHPNYIASLRNGDADTVLELLPHIQARNPASTVRVLTPGQTGFDDLTGHLVLLGEIGAASESAGAMPYLVRRLALPLGVYLPAEGDTEFDREFVVFVDDDGEPSEDGRGRERHGPRYLMGEGGSGGRRVLVEGYPALEYDVALLARSANPFNLATTVTIASGIFSRGTFGAVRSLTDPNLATTNEQWLRANVDPDDFWMLMHVPVFSGPNGAQTLTPDLTRPFHRLRVWSRRK